MKTAHYLTLGLLSLFIISLLSFAGRDILFTNATQVSTSIGAYQEQATTVEDKKEDGQESGEKKDPESNELEDDKKSSVSTLTFNFIYYLIYKFKLADLL